MKPFREWDILDNDFLQSAYRGEPEGASRALSTMIVIMAGILLVWLPTGVFLDFVLGFGNWSPLIAIIPWALAAWRIPVIGRKHVLWGIDSYYREHARFYYECSKKERLLYPADIQNVFRKARPEYRLLEALNKLRHEIIANRGFFAEAPFDVRQVIEDLGESTKNLQIDNDVYREYL